MNEQIESYNFFASLFFNLPDKVFVDNILSQEYSGDAPGIELIKSYVESVKGVDIDKILDELLVDRTYLMHGLYRNGPRPPYETVYTVHVPNEIDKRGSIPEAAEKKRIGGLRELNVMYRESGMKVGKEAHQPPDYLGMELVFMEELCKNGDETFEKRKEFFNTHLNRFGTEYANEMIKFAKTDFWRGIGHLLKTFMEEEARFYSDDD